MLKINDPPHDFKAEGALIGSMIVEPECIPRIREWVRENEFFNADAKKIFRLLVDMHTVKDGIDAVLLSAKFPKKEYEELFEYMKRALETLPSSANAVYYAQQVHKKATERELANLIKHGYSALMNDGLTADQKISQLSTMANLSKMFSTEGQEQTVNDLIQSLLKDLTDGGRQPLSTGLNNIDEIIGGLGHGQLILVAGVTSMGKTSLMLDFFIHTARIGARPYFYYLEMLAEHLAERMVRNIARTAILDPTDDSIRETMFVTENWPAWIERKPHREISQICLQIHSMKSTKDIGVCFVDHIQKIHAPGRDYIQQMSNITNSLSELACELKIPIVAACQLNREALKRDKHRPKISDLRGSGSLEHDSDVVLLLHRDDYFREEEGKTNDMDGLAECIVGKNRHGRKGVAQLVWLPEYFSFSDYNKIDETMF